MPIDPKTGMWYYKYSGSGRRLDPARIKEMERRRNAELAAQRKSRATKAQKLQKQGVSQKVADFAARQNVSVKTARSFVQAGYSDIPKIDPGRLSRSASDIVRGKSAYNPKQVDSNVYRQVEAVRMQKYFAGKKDYTAQEYLSSYNRIMGTTKQKAKSESDARARTSTTQAKSAAVEARTEYQKSVQQSQQQNLQAQKAAEAAQAQKVGASIDISSLTPSERAPQTGAPQMQVLVEPEIKQVQQPDQSLVSPYIKEGSTDRPKQAQQPDQSKVSPFLKQQLKAESERIDAIIGSVTSPQAVQITKEKSNEFAGQRQDYPKPFTIQEFFRGFYEGGVKPLGEAILAPKPIFTDIAGPTKDELKIRKEIVEKHRKLIQPGPTASGALLEQALTGQPLKGTGEGPAYDIGSLSFDVALAVAPTRKIPTPIKFAKIGQDKIIIAGLGSKLKPIATITGSKITKGYDVTKIGKEGYKQIAESFNIKPKGGAEIDALGDVESTIITSSKNLEKLKVSGILSSEDVKLIQAGKVGVKESAKLPEKKFSETLGDEPFENIKKGKETTTIKEVFKEEGVTLEGSAIDIPTFLPKFVGKAGDFDVKVANFVKAQELAKKTAARLTQAAREERMQRVFVARGGKIEVFERGVSKGKVGEFLAPDDPEAAGQIARTGKVLGVKTTKKKMKIEGIKMKTGKFQISRRIASITSIQPTKEGIRIGPPINPVGVGATRAKDFPRAYAGLLSRAYVAREKGQFARAERLEQAAKDIRSVGEKYIDFDEFFRTRRYSTMKLEAKEGLKVSSPLIEKTSPNIIQANKLTGSPSSSLINEMLSIKSSPSPSRGSSPYTESPYVKNLTSKSPSPSATQKGLIGSTSKSAISSVTKSALMISIGSPGSPAGKGSKSPGSPGSPGGSGKPGLPKRTSSASMFSPRTKKLAAIERKKKPIGAIINWRTTQKKRIEEKRKKKVDFFGSTNIEEITGFRSKKIDLEYGDVKTAKAARKNILGTRAKRPRVKLI